MFDTIKSSAAFKRIQRAMQSLLSFIRKFLRDWSLNFGGMLAYSLLVAMVPMSVAFFGIFGLILKDYPEAQQAFTNQILTLVPNGTLIQAATKEITTLAIVQLEEDAGALLAIGLVLAIFGASRFFTAVDKCLSVIYRIPQRSFIRRNLVAMGMVLILFVLFTIIIAATIAPSITTRGMESNGTRAGIYIGGVLCSLLVIFILFELIYWLIPNRKMPFKYTWCGALVATCLFEIVIVWFPVYAEDNTNSYTGLVGFALMFILLFYYFSLILILGAQINAYCFEDYLPYDEGLANILSHAYHASIEGDSRKPLINENTDIIELKYQ